MLFGDIRLEQGSKMYSKVNVSSRELSISMEMVVFASRPYRFRNDYAMKLSMYNGNDGEGSILAAPYDTIVQKIGGCIWSHDTSVPIFDLGHKKSEPYYRPACLAIIFLPRVFKNDSQCCQQHQEDVTYYIVDKRKRDIPINCSTKCIYRFHERLRIFP